MSSKYDENISGSGFQETSCLLRMIFIQFLMTERFLRPKKSIFRSPSHSNTLPLFHATDIDISVDSASLCFLSIG